jgi:hypothetical protein
MLQTYNLLNLRRVHHFTIHSFFSMWYVTILDIYYFLLWNSMTKLRKIKILTPVKPVLRTTRAKSVWQIRGNRRRNSQTKFTGKKWGRDIVIILFIYFLLWNSMTKLRKIKILTPVKPVYTEPPLDWRICSA